MEGLPVVLNLRERLCVVVGGGAVALRRANSLAAAGARVRVIAPRVHDGFDRQRVELEQRGFVPDDLAGAFLVVAATDDAQVNRQVSEAAAARGVLVNRTDDAAAGDFTVPAIAERGPIRLTVDTGGRSASAARRLREECLAGIDPTWDDWLACIGDYRPIVQERIGDAAKRQQLLKRFASDEARAILMSRGRDGLRQTFDEWIADAA